MGQLSKSAKKKKAAPIKGEECVCNLNPKKDEKIPECCLEKAVKEPAKSEVQEASEKPKEDSKVGKTLEEPKKPRRKRKRIKVKSEGVTINTGTVLLGLGIAGVLAALTKPPRQKRIAVMEVEPQKISLEVKPIQEDVEIFDK